jgi:hypothetical protein
MDGAVYEWTLKDFKRDKENVLKGCSYNCVVATNDHHQTFAVGSDRKLKEFEDAQVSKEFDTGAVLTQICLPASGRWDANVTLISRYCFSPRPAGVTQISRKYHANITLLCFPASGRYQC